MPVTKNHQAVDGILAYPDLASLPMAPELAIIGTLPQAVPSLVRALGQRGTHAALVFTSGLSEVWDDALGRTLQQAMVEAARTHNLHILGPSSQGLLVPSIGLNASLSLSPARRGNIAFVSQSGAMCNGVLDWARPKDIGFAHCISLGDCADVGFGEVLDYLCTEPATRAILLHIQTIAHPRNFLSAARAAARNKPVLALKTGRVTQALREAPSCSGASAGPDQVYDAALRRAGILRVFDIEELFAAVETLARAHPLKGERLAIVTNGNSIGDIAADVLAQGGGRLAPLAEETVEGLARLLPMTGARSNPLDIRTDADGERYADTLTILLEAHEVDAVLVMHMPTALASSTEVAKAVINVAQKSSRSILTCWFGGEAVASGRRLFAKAGIPSYESPSMAARAFLHMMHYRRNQDLLMQTPRSLDANFMPSSGTAKAILRDIRIAGREVLNDPEAKQLIAAYDIPTVVTKLASNPAEAARLAASIGFPVAITRLALNDASNRLHCSNARLHLYTPRAVAEAAQQLIAYPERGSPDESFVGFSVRPMVRRSKAYAAAIGVTMDPVFGPVILFGHGGSAARLTDDTAVGLPPLNMHLAWELISRTRFFRVLQGYAGHNAADIDALCLTLVKLSQLVLDTPNIMEVQINPLLVDEHGVLALETCLRVTNKRWSATDHLAIRPYPQELEENVTLKTGRAVRLRPIRPEDEPLYQAFIGKLTTEDRHFRFWGYVGEFSHSQIAYLTQIDYDREMAFVATAANENGELEILGEGRTSTDPENVTSECSVVVRADVRRMGLGRILMERMIDYCSRCGTEALIGYVLRENRTMLRMANAMGFQCESIADEPRACQVSLQLRNRRKSYPLACARARSPAL